LKINKGSEVLTSASSAKVLFVDTTAKEPVKKVHKLDRSDWLLAQRKAQPTN